jgi:cardiolipin synthase
LTHRVRSGEIVKPGGWTSGNRLKLLENGEEYYPRLYARIAKARRQILIETFIWFEDRVGTEFANHLIDAARRGVEVRVTADGYGSPGFSRAFLAALHGAGVKVQLFDPRPTLFWIRINVLCRLHRKIVVIDGETAFVGGINYSDDHLREFSGASKQDFAVEVEGPAVPEIRDYVQNRMTGSDGPWWRRWRYWLRRFSRDLQHPDPDAQVLFATRDNDQHPTDIETLYRIAIRNAKTRIVITNAYFLPGYRFIRDLLHARKRGVEVELVMQGSPDLPLAIGTASVLFDELASAGVKIHRYMERPLHAKVAVVDDHWATVGSSNLDPISLGLNYEANLFILDREFNRALRRSLDRLIANSCEQYTIGTPTSSLLRRLLAALVFHLARRAKTLGVLMPRRRQRITPMEPPSV